MCAFQFRIIKHSDFEIKRLKIKTSRKNQALGTMEVSPGTSKEKIESVDENEKKTMMKEMFKPLPALEAMPVEVLVKIFNFLKNHDIRCGVSLACTKFYEICQDQSLVPVNDLYIYGPVDRKSKKKGNQSYSLRYIEACFIETVSEVITQSQNLTFLKIKDLNPEIVDELVSTALQACSKLTHLEIVETPQPTGKYILNVKLHFSKHNSRYNIIIKNSR